MSVEDILAAVAELSAEEKRRVWSELDELRRPDPEAPEPQRPSAYDLAKGLIGPGSGLHDLGSSKEHLRGFGWAHGEVGLLLYSTRRV